MRKMRLVQMKRRAVIGVAAAAVLIAGAFLANSVLRPGCSLLPVTLPQDPSGRTVSATREQVCAALGRPLPEAKVLPDRVQTTGAFIGGPPVGRLHVSVGYTQDGHGVGFLEITHQPTNAIPEGNKGEVNGTVAGVPAIIKGARSGSQDADQVDYLWVRDGLEFILHMQLGPGLTREAVDAMAASIQ